MANGTAVNVVTMVFGNRGDDSATGVAFTRNPGTGENKLYGEYLVNAQGEDVVAGIRTPKPHRPAQGVEMPEMAKQLDELRDKLESHYKEVQDFEFTIERGKLYCLQTRNGKMNADGHGAHLGRDGAAKGSSPRSRRCCASRPSRWSRCCSRAWTPRSRPTAVAQGLPASPGAASGIAVFDADRAEQLGKEQGLKVILVREETKPEDIHGFFASEGILTSRGGKTSHAAVVARGMGKPCVAGAEGISVDVDRREARCRATPASRKATSSPSTAPPVRSIWARSRPWSRSSPPSWTPCSTGRTRWPGSRSWPTPTPRTMPVARSSTAPSASAWPAPSACSMTWNACRSSSR